MQITRSGRISASLVLIAHPTIAVASDPTPMFVALVGAPAVVLSIGLLALSYLKPRFALAPAILVLLAHIPLMVWASSVGYMSGSASIWLYLSSSLSTYSLILSWVRRHTSRSQKSGT